MRLLILQITLDERVFLECIFWNSFSSSNNLATFAQKMPAKLCDIIWFGDWRRCSCSAKCLNKLDKNLPKRQQKCLLFTSFMNLYVIDVSRGIRAQTSHHQAGSWTWKSDIASFIINQFNFSWLLRLSKKDEYPVLNGSFFTQTLPLYRYLGLNWGRLPCGKKVFHSLDGSSPAPLIYHTKPKKEL